MQWFPALLLTVTLSGCSNQLPTFPVNGKVVFPDGSPVHIGTVELKSREHGIQARGTIDSEGNFKLSTYRDGDGAVAGLHDCVVVQFVMTEGFTGHRPSTIGVIDRRYNSYATSGLSVEIKPEGVNNVILEVEGLRKLQPQVDQDHHH